MALRERNSNLNRFYKRLFAACRINGHIELPKRGDRVLQGLESALKYLIKNGIETSVSLAGVSPKSFWHDCEDCNLIRGSREGARSIELDFKDKAQAYNVLRFNDVSESKVMYYVGAAEVFARALEEEGRKPTRALMRAVSYRGLRGKRS